MNAVGTENVSQQTLDLMKQALGTPSEQLRKTVSTGTGLVPYDLQAPSKNLYPVATPLRNVIPRVGGGVGTATHWVSIFAIVGSGYDAMGWVPEGQRTPRMSYQGVNKAASYKTMGEEDNITFEAINAGKTFEDVIATGVMRILQKMMLKEENAILGGNTSVQLGTVGTITTSASGSGGTLPATTYYVQCVALTHEGFKNSSVAGGVASTQTFTGADGQTYVLNGGSSIAASQVSQSVSSGNTLYASVPAINGAHAYAWYIGTTTGQARLQAITTINSLAWNTPISSTTQLCSSLPGTDCSTNTLAYDGLLYNAWNSPNGAAYINTLPTGTAGTGTFLTSSGRGSINEIDTMLVNMWDNFQVSPTVLYVNAQELQNITAKVLSNASGPLLRYDVSGTGGDNPYAIMASGVVSAYFNPFALNGGFKIPIKIHPFLAPGTIIGWTEQLPAQYQNNETPNVAEMKVRADYYSLEWPIKTRAREYGVYCEEVLAVYASFALGMINNIGNG